ncbi:unnamed protein product [Cunninghamella blakesleeana]
MIQATLFNYFTCNNSGLLKQTKTTSSPRLKQTQLVDYFTMKRPKNQSTIIDYFSKKEEKGSITKKKKKDSVIDIILIDIHRSSAYSEDIQCVKRNLYDKDLNYIALSYRRGQVNEQLVKTPNYTSSVTSFDLFHLRDLCNCIRREPDLKHIQYLWIDAISMNYYHDEKKKKSTIHYLTQIYQKASYILAVPDLHLKSLLNNPSNRYYIHLVEYYRNNIYQYLLSSSSSLPLSEATPTTVKLIDDINHKELKEAYDFLQYLVDDWSNRVWVNYEYSLAKEKMDTPMKYIFIMLLDYNTSSFFSYSFYKNEQQQKQQQQLINKNHVYSQQWIDFMKKKLIQREPLEMILNLITKKNEDRFYAILPIWKKYQHKIQSLTTISEWKITDMVSVRLKLFEIMDDLWDKARLLYACSMNNETTFLPSFASQYQPEYLTIMELDHPEKAHKYYSEFLLSHLLNLLVDHHSLDICIINEKYNQVLQMKSGLFLKNLLDIQYSSSAQLYLTLKAKKFFIYNQPLVLNDSFLKECSLKKDGSLSLIYIPYFICSNPSFFHIIPNEATGITLVGNSAINRWVLCDIHLYTPTNYIPSSNNYTFHIY